MVPTGQVLARQRRLEEACEAFQRAIRWTPRTWCRWTLRPSACGVGKARRGAPPFRRVLALRPRLGWFGSHGQLLRPWTKPERKIAFRGAGKPGRNASPWWSWQAFCQSRGGSQRPRKTTQTCLTGTSNAQLYVGAGQNLAALGHYAEAARYSGEAVRLAPAFAEARLLMACSWRSRYAGRGHGAVSRSAAAQAGPPRRAVNLGLVLMNQGHAAEALEQFEAVLRQSPSEPRALKYARACARASAPDRHLSELGHGFVRRHDAKGWRFAVPVCIAERSLMAAWRAPQTAGCL